MIHTGITLYERYGNEMEIKWFRKGVFWQERRGMRVRRRR